MECKFGGQSDGCHFDEESYNKALEDFSKGIKEILEDNAIYNFDCIDTLVKQLTK